MIYNDPMFWPKKKPKKVRLTMTGFSSNELIYVEIGGIRYGGGQVIDVEAGSTANCYIDGALAFNLRVIVNGVTVASGDSDNHARYAYTVTKNATINFASNPINASITITEES